MVRWSDSISRHRALPIVAWLERDPALLCPGITASSPGELVDLLEQWSTDHETYPHDELERFVGDSFAGCSSNPAEDIASFAIARVKER